ncbi:MAG: hypothetical protein IJY06_06135 [Oscillospiraceae bacterium]|nr:hypothetical protein [Oscillospiraceae bacterium]
MKKKLTALLTAFLFFTSTTAVSSVYAVDAEISIDDAFSITTDTFTYSNNNRYNYQNGFILETELADPDLMVVGVSYYNDSEEISDYIVTPVNNESIGSGGVGKLSKEIVLREVGDQQLCVGDLLKVDGELLAADVIPTYYTPMEEGTMSYLGNGVDIFGEEFKKVIRLQLVIEQTAYERYQEMGVGVYDIDLLKGDVTVDDTLNIADCLAINKNLLAGAPLCDYAKLAGDINRNGAPDADDSLSILKEVLHVTENFE